MRDRLEALLLSLILSSTVIACRSSTTDPNSKVIQLKGRLIEFAKGNITEIEAQTAPGEMYILLSGYPETVAEKQLPISEQLRDKLKRIMPPQSSEMLVLARITDDEVQEYTEWNYTGADYHPVLSPVPVVIKGSPYRIKRKPGRSAIVDFEIDN